MTSDSAPKTPPFWNGDKLKREAEATKLQAFLIKKYSRQKSTKTRRHLVTGLKASWGTGKTYLLSNWKADLISQNFVCISFDAWKNDVTSDPLVGLVAAIQKQIEEQVPQSKPRTVSLEGLRGAAKFVIRKTPKLALKGVIESALPPVVSKLFLEVLDAENQTYDPVEEHNDRLEYIAKFKGSLKSLVGEIPTWDENKPQELPLFIFIDELDRCRPTYAIEVLEAVKHLFDVDDVYFVIAADLTELAHSVKSIYGQDFNAAKYLRRFFDVEYLLAEPSKKDFIAQLFQSQGLDQFTQNLSTPFDSDEQTSDERNENIQAAFAAVCAASKLSLRDIEQVALLFEAALTAQDHGKRKLCTYFLMLLICFRYAQSDVFQKCTTLSTTPEILYSTLTTSLFYQDLDNTLFARDFHSLKSSHTRDALEINILIFIQEYSIFMKSTYHEIKDEIYAYQQEHRHSQKPTPLRLRIATEIQLSTPDWDTRINTNPTLISPISDYWHLVNAIGQFSVGE